MWLTWERWAHKVKIKLGSRRQDNIKMDLKKGACWFVRIWLLDKLEGILWKRQSHIGFTAGWEFAEQLRNFQFLTDELVTSASFLFSTMSLVKCRIEAKVLLRTILVVCKLLTEGRTAAKHRSVLQMDISSQCSWVPDTSQVTPVCCGADEVAIRITPSATCAETPFCTVKTCLR
jgi:hypothetical protein